MAARKKAARSGAKASGKGKTRAKATRSESSARSGGSSGKKAGKHKKATNKAVSVSVKHPARPGHPPVKVAKATRKTARRVVRKATRKTAATSKAATSSGFPEIADLAELMQQHGLVEVEYECSTDGTTRIHVKRAGAAAEPLAVASPFVQQAGSAAPAVAPAPAAEPEPVVADDLHAFKSPMVGTFYRAPSPEASSFASVGDTIEPSSTVCIIEAMKVMNEITPDVSGEVVSIEVENGEAVEFGQTLMLIRTR